jgi:hypothetical protein
MPPPPARDPRIPSSKIPVKGVVGLVFTLLFMTLILIALPQARWFFLFTVPAGALVGGVLYLINRR